MKIMLTFELMALLHIRLEKGDELLWVKLTDGTKMLFWLQKMARRLFLKKKRLDQQDELRSVSKEWI